MTDERPDGYPTTEPVPLPPQARSIVRRTRREMIATALATNSDADAAVMVSDILNRMGESLHPLRDEIGAEWLARATAQLASDVVDVLRALVRHHPENGTLLSHLVDAYEMEENDLTVFAGETPEDVVAAAESLLRDPDTDHNPNEGNTP